jgi:hypothetical protein
METVRASDGDEEKREERRDGSTISLTHSILMG